MKRCLIVWKFGMGKINKKLKRPTNRGKPPAAGCRPLQSATLAARCFSRAAPTFGHTKVFGANLKKKGLYGSVADSSPSPKPSAPDSTSPGRARMSKGARQSGCRALWGLQVLVQLRPAAGRKGSANSMAASSAQSGAAPWCRTIAKLCAVQKTGAPRGRRPFATSAKCCATRAARPSAAASRRPWPGAARVEGPVSAATWLILPVVICLS